MGLFDSIKKSLEGSTKNFFMDSAKKIPDMLMNLRRCRDEELREKMKGQITSTMRALKQYASLGDEKAMFYYENYKQRFKRDFEENNINF